MAKRFNVLLEWDVDDQVWVAYVPTLNWLSTFGETREEALEQTLEAAAKEGMEMPKADSETELAAIEVAVP